ncbi:MAG: DUF2064 domain-containing protein [Planctomycetes bacterium]|nr:DUF2064 domain-containing protein [Planctomycetota bacterium]
MGSATCRKRLLLFGKVPETGRVKTRLVPPLSADSAARLYAAFLSDVVGASQFEGEGVETTLYLWPDPGAAGTELTGSHATLAIQDGTDLTERMQNAFTACFDDGCRHVVLRNTDSPLLPRARILGAFEALEDGAELVIGPDHGGGYYLVGAAAAARESLAPVLAEIGSGPAERVFARTVARARIERLATFVLRTEDDVDDAEDLARLRAQLAEDHDRAPATRRVLLHLFGATQP